MVSTVEWRKKISKLKTIDLIPFEKKRGNILRNQNRATRTCGTIRSIISVIRGLEGEEKEGWAEKVLQIMAEKCYKFGNRHKSIDLRSWTRLSKIHPKKSTSKQIIVKHLKTKTKKKSWKQQDRKYTLQMEENHLNSNRYSH